MVMKRLFGISLFLMVMALACSAQLQIPMGNTPSDDNSRKAPRSNTRTLTGTVMDKSDKPVADAIVYLKNTKTLAMKTYIAKNDGSYRFPELSTNVDYEVYAQKNGVKSNTKTLSQFDDRNKANINLQIDTTKK
jgi:hypothetical protein